MSSDRSGDDIEVQQNDPSVRDAPAGVDGDDSYTSRTGQKNAPIPVQSDADATGVNNPVDDPDSDKALGMLPSSSTSLASPPASSSSFTSTCTNRAGRCLQNKTRPKPSTSPTSSTSAPAAGEPRAI